MGCGGWVSTEVSGRIRIASFWFVLWFLLPFFWKSVSENIQTQHYFIVHTLEETSRPVDGSSGSRSKHTGVKLRAEECTPFFDNNPSQLATFEGIPYPFHILNLV